MEQEDLQVCNKGWGVGLATPFSAQNSISVFPSSQEAIPWLRTWGRSDCLLINIPSAYFMHRLHESYAASRANLKDRTKWVHNLNGSTGEIFESHLADEWLKHVIILQPLFTFFLSLFCFFYLLHLFHFSISHLSCSTCANKQDIILTLSHLAKLWPWQKGPFSKGAGRKINMEENKGGALPFFSELLNLSLISLEIVFIPKRQLNLKCRMKGMTSQGLTRNCAFHKKKESYSSEQEKSDVLLTPWYQGENNL